MSNSITRILFAGASMVLTAGAIAAATPAFAATDLRQTSVRVSDLDLSTATGRKAFDRRLHYAANRVCPAITGTRIASSICLDEAIAKGRKAAERSVAVAASGEPAAAL